MDGGEGLAEEYPRIGAERACFASFTFDAGTLELFDGDRPVPLEPRPARILARLVRTPGALVPRDDLLALGWPRLPDAANDSLNTCIRQIREALGDDARSPRFVETLRGRGYRFIAPLRTNRPSRRRWPALAAVLAVLLLGPVPRPARPAAGPEVRAELSAVRWVLQRDGAERAVALSGRTAARFPDAPAAHALHGEVLLFLGRLDAAKSEAVTALAGDARDPVALRVRATVAALQGDWQQADAWMEDATAADPDDAHTWIARAFLVSARARFAEAEDAIDRAIAIDPLSATVNGDAGLLHLYAGRFDAAARACAKTLELDPRAAWAAGCVFDAHVAAGDEHAAAGAATALQTWGVRLPGTGTAADTIAAVRAWRVARSKAGGPTLGGSYRRALALADVGRTSEAVDALVEAAATPIFGVLTAAVDPRLRKLAGDPRYDRLLERLGLARL